MTTDILIAGGGIVGAGIARDAASRGLRTLLVEQADFASGTSSRSTRLLHGGIRYLAQGNVALVLEASLEKVRVSRFAPHLCQPLAFYFPTRRGTAWPRWQLAIGVRIYDLLCGGHNLGASATYGREEMLRKVPGLEAAGLTGGVRYYDALTNDARLTIDTLRSAVRHGAKVRNYARLVAAERADREWVCTVADAESGATSEVRSATVVNAAGAWANRLPNSTVRLRLTKGVHLVIDRSRLPVDGAVVLPEGRRILFAIPWGDRVILGTTDTDYVGDPAEVRTEPDDVDYILGVVNNGFKGARLTSGDIIATWAGVRPLIAPRRSQAGSPSDTSRKHEIHMPEPGWFEVAGGKLTAYRLMGEQVVDKVGRYLRAGLPASRTAAEPLLEDAAEARYSGVLPPPVEREVVTHCCHNEWTRHLDDLMLRRTSWHFYHRGQDEIARQSCRWMAAELGWDEARATSEMERYRLAVEKNT